MKTRLDQELAFRGIVATRSQAESYIKLGKVSVNERIITKPSFLVASSDDIELKTVEQYVSRAALKLASVAKILELDFKDKVVLDVGSSTGGFTDYALKHGAKKVVAIDVGTNQMHPSLRTNPKVELHEQTDVRDIVTQSRELRAQSEERRIVIATPDIILIDVSFISLRSILPHCSKLTAQNSLIVAMAKPQFEVYAERSRSTQHPSASSGFRIVRKNSKMLNKGVIKNDKIRRFILKNLENWIQNLFIIISKADSKIPGSKGNVERFYLLKPLKNINH